jgi:hypothetical protein
VTVSCGTSTWTAWTAFFDFVLAVAAVAVVVATGSVFAAVGLICWIEEAIALPLS